MLHGAECHGVRERRIPTSPNASVAPRGSCGTPKALRKIRVGKACSWRERGQPPNGMQKQGVRMQKKRTETEISELSGTAFRITLGKIPSLGNPHRGRARIGAGEEQQELLVGSQLPTPKPSLAAGAGIGLLVPAPAPSPLRGHRVERPERFLLAALACIKSSPRLLHIHHLRSHTAPGSPFGEQ